MDCLCYLHAFFSSSPASLHVYALFCLHGMYIKLVKVARGKYSKKDGISQENLVFVLF